MGSGDMRGLLLAGMVGAVGVTLAVLTTASSAEDKALERARAERDAASLEALLACAAKSPAACRCADAAEELALDLGRYADARKVIDGVECPRTARHLGGRAETLAANGDSASALAEANAALALDPGEPHACLAKAWVFGGGGEAVGLAERAVKGGRGTPALLLLGALELKAGEVAGATKAMDDAAKLAPRDARVAYNVGLAAQQAGRYHDAREAYLRALALDPKMVDARYALVVLTHGRGADDEARHHLEKLQAIDPSDPRVAAARAMLGAK